MAVAILSFISSLEEISSGIPKTVEIESNIPSTIHYTLDGTVPSIDSMIYIEPLNMPTGVNSVVLSAFAIDSDGHYSPILTQAFAPDVSSLDGPRYVGLEGIVVDRVGSGEDIIDGYGADNTAIRFLDIQPINLDLVKTPDQMITNKVYVPDPKSTPSFYDDNFEEVSSPESAQFFNPSAKVIVIDNRINNEVTLMPRPYGSLSNPYKEFGGKRILNGTEATYITGGFVKRFYNPVTKTMVGYYFDHNEGRHIKNIQSLPSNIPQMAFGGVSVPAVIRWINWGRQSTI